RRRHRPLLRRRLSLRARRRQPATHGLHERAEHGRGLARVDRGGVPDGPRVAVTSSSLLGAARAEVDVLAALDLVETDGVVAGAEDVADLDAVLLRALLDRVEGAQPVELAMDLVHRAAWRTGRALLDHVAL